MNRQCRNCTYYWKELDPETLLASGRGYCYRHRHPILATDTCSDFYAPEWSGPAFNNRGFVEMRMECPLCRCVHIYRLSTDELLEEYTVLGDEQCPHCKQWLSVSVSVNKSSGQRA